MQTKIDLDIELIHNAMAISGLKAKEEVVNQALKEFIERQAKL